MENLCSVLAILSAASGVTQLWPMLGRCSFHDAHSSHDDIMGLKLEPTLQIAPLSPGNCYEALQLL